ncbi:hypothetical protein CEE37_01205 [candidate division LCP-89 bacterium B3_LCP]|uniref:Fibronectin type-III domain-containing protein n=1 Tax=candidate division LCP-89 bacterium B3_LCP TaxID=2012998 RepID=A0A532V5U7_UNCL8|nr:MAG: hypothetical protein CEE37_01205 [candidate division LCP-89 bacterium B3_LCP]
MNMIRKRISFSLMIGLMVLVTIAGARDDQSIIQKYQPPETAIANIARYNRVHRKGNIWMNFTNWGFFGNYSNGDPDAMEDPEYPGTWAPQCEYPGASDVQYLFMAAIWVGALVEEAGFYFPRISVGSEGWTGPGRNNFELEPGEIGGLPQKEHGIRERSTIQNSYNRLGEYVYDEDAIAEQDYLAVYTDTLDAQFWTGSDIVDGPHFPLGVRISQSSYSWSYNYAQDFILIDYEFENIASNFLRNFYIGLYVDADVGLLGSPSYYEDDICGFQRWYYYDRYLPDGSTVPDSLIINTAYISDNDGRPQTIDSGNDYTCPDVTGTRVVRAPNPRLETSFNWWISNGNSDLDFGPSWLTDGSEGNWTATYGTPNGDARKYFVMSNGEFDYDQIHVADDSWIEDNPQITYDEDSVATIHPWKIEEYSEAGDLANGYDTRYLISWGPLGIRDHQEPGTGEWVYRLNPGEKFHMTMAYIAGANFHTPDAPQGNVSGTNPVNESLFNFAHLQHNAAWAARVFDNDMVDTNGDGWYGEDVGSDMLYAENIGDSVIYFGEFIDIYPGPDADGTERNGKLDANEDGISRPEFVYDPRYGELNIGYTQYNNVIDLGDGIPDFKGPPPPPIPELSYELTETEVILRWNNNSEDQEYFDPFSHAQDFEGYRIYVSNTGLEYDYQLLAEFDVVDFAYYSITDSLATIPDAQTNGAATIDTLGDGLTYYRKPVNTNTGLLAIEETDSTYIYAINNAHALFPRYYSVTAFDFGDPSSGTEPLETARNANRVYVAPSGNPQNKVSVVPNPYRAYEDYTQTYIETSPGSGLSWENQDDGTPDYFPQTDRRLEFINLPIKCLIRIYTVAGDLVQIIPHTTEIINNFGDPNTGWVSDHSEGWDLNNRNGQQVVSGLYMFSVENLTSGNEGNIEVGKFVIIR